MKQNYKGKVKNGFFKQTITIEIVTNMRYESIDEFAYETLYTNPHSILEHTFKTDKLTKAEAKAILEETGHITGWDEFEIEE